VFLASQALHRDIPDSVLSQTFFDGDGLFLYVPEKKYTNGKLLRLLRSYGDLSIPFKARWF